ncbi:MAG: SUMF1/EgtB/PvdO family nonheme iron enzyme [Verrucomicrobiota bacterium]|jgi:formylglycine-generating enzyme required for sulfatase activity|nr:SUMF1/EgtB/PvdO family nonheme iron enzyme [Verrucomicrobiota bacterium]MDP6252565.1 SUMF1/EgtB/PvdO family nonheme iron enzyme [Verrucomicrobiota bacterium]MDP7178972.1 SUMF1/EgtB/PvdO family nonheme iron enzyme [Verrucomicrobiota bacterium]MDP7291712.1 SUMF1/EgtB/PvdO family nonheme iron enzyme [Verrucomicrobiota bacterium]MDP7442275.1 SUMF1/EgtB/PvdO family nonheme iron enzyme [Verrucomicrobiota bacterium]
MVNRLLSTGAALAWLGGLAKAEVSFEKHVQPVLASACLSCHGEKKDKGELRLHTLEDLLKGGENGKVIVPGKPEESTLYTSTILPPDDDEIMPPKGETLTSDQADVLKEWIAAGAKWPEGLVIKQVRRIDFVKDIKPILEESCVSCHREEHDKGDLRLDERKYAFEGGEVDPSVVPFDLEKSTLYLTSILPADHDDLMPPEKKGGPLPQEQLDKLRDWIVQGAAWPEGLKLKQVRRDIGKPETGGSIIGAPKVVVDIRGIAIEKLIEQLEPTMKPFEDEIPGTGVKFEMLPIPSGEFVMGSPDGESGRKESEGPQHKVKISPFWMARTETTWNAYTLFIYEEEEKMVMKIRGYKPKLNAVSDAVARPTTPYVEMSFGMGTENYPAISMTQHGASTYCKWLTAKTGHYYRLPTEAEWEYACRAGTTTAYSFGDDPSMLDNYAWHDGNSNFKYHKVGTKEPNPWGLHDMHGNVSEWTLDQYVPDSYATFKDTASNPFEYGKELYPRVVRGGSWMDKPEGLRSAVRIASSSDWKEQDPQLPKSIWYHTETQFLGFRVIRPLVIPSAEDMHKYWTTEGEPD